MYLPGQSSCHLYMAFKLLQNQASGHVKVKKGTRHVFYMATPSHTNESVWTDVYLYAYTLIPLCTCLLTPNPCILIGSQVWYMRPCTTPLGHEV